MTYLMLIAPIVPALVWAVYVRRRTLDACVSTRVVQALLFLGPLVVLGAIAAVAPSFAQQAGAAGQAAGVSPPVAFTSRITGTNKDRSSSQVGNS